MAPLVGSATTVSGSGSLPALLAPLPSVGRPAAGFPGSVAFTPSTGAFGDELVQFTAYGFGPPTLLPGGHVTGFTARLSINGRPFEDVPAQWTLENGSGVLNGSFVMPDGTPGTVYQIGINATAQFQYTLIGSVVYPLYATTWADTWGPTCVPPCTPYHFHLLVSLRSPPFGYTGTLSVSATGINPLYTASGIALGAYLYVDQFVSPTNSTSGNATFVLESYPGTFYHALSNPVEVVVPPIPPTNTSFGASVAMPGFFTTDNTTLFDGVSALEGQANGNLTLDARPASPSPPILVDVLYGIIALVALLATVIALEVAILRRTRRPPTPGPPTSTSP